jgi:Flp pilus assembly protein TadD
MNLSRAILCLSLVAALFLSSPLLAAETDPKFGGVKRTPAEETADKIFVGEAIAKHASRDGARDSYLQVGFDAAKKGDGAEAMAAVNKAWLIDPTNHRVAWGFGVALGVQGKYSASLKYFEEAKKGDPNNARILCDYALSTFRGAVTSSDKAAFDEGLAASEKLYIEAQAMAPKDDCSLAGLSVVSFARGDFKRSWGFVIDAERVGGGSLDPQFLKSLESKMKRPA